MRSHENDLGRVVSRHTTAPAFLQRAAIVAATSFVFFISMLMMFYVRQQIGYFLLSTGFLLVYVFTFIGWVTQKRNVVTLYEHGVEYRKLRFHWDEIHSVVANNDGLRLSGNGQDVMQIPRTVSGYKQILRATQLGVEQHA